MPTDITTTNNVKYTPEDSEEVDPVGRDQAEPESAKGSKEGQRVKS